jgi:hypothetical protein
MGSRIHKRLLMLGIAAMLGLFGFAPAVAQDTAPTVGDIVIDGFDCDTGQVSFHVPVTDLPLTPSDVNAPLGYSITGNYEQGSAGLPARGYTPAAEEAPYTGDVHLTLSVPMVGDESLQGTSGPLQSIVLHVSVGTSDGTGPTDTSTLTYEVGCGADGEGTSPPASGDDAGETTGEGESDGSDETVQLPSTGTGAVDSGPSSAALATMLGAALLLGATALRLRRQA